MKMVVDIDSFKQEIKADDKRLLNRSNELTDEELTVLSLSVYGQAMKCYRKSLCNDLGVEDIEYLFSILRGSRILFH